MNRKTKRVVREETGRTAVWLFFSAIGWGLLVDSTPGFTLSTVELFAAIFGTAVAMSGVVVGIRLATGRELQGGTESKDLLLVTTLFVMSLYLLWSYLTANWTSATWGLVAVSVLTVAVRVVRPSILGIDSTGR